MKLFSGVLILSFLMSFNSYAKRGGDEKGNGGGAWVCEVDGKVRKIEIIDLYEAKFFFEYKIDENLSYDELYSLIEKRIVSFDSGLADLYQVHKEAFLLAKKERSIDLTETFDHQPLMNAAKNWCPKGEVRIVQLVNYLDSGEVILNKDYLPSLSSYQRAVIENHEIIYSMRRELFRDTLSINARKVLALLVNEDFEKNSLSSYFQKLGKLHSYELIQKMPAYQAFRELRKYGKRSLAIDFNYVLDTKWSCIGVENSIEFGTEGFISRFDFLENEKEIDLSFSSLENHMEEGFILQAEPIVVYDELFNEDFFYIVENKEKSLLRFNKTPYDTMLTDLTEEKNVVLKRYKDLLILEETFSSDMPYFNSVSHEGLKAQSYGICKKVN